MMVIMEDPGGKTFPDESIISCVYLIIAFDTGVGGSGHRVASLQEKNS